MSKFVRRSFFVEPNVIRKLRRALGVKSDTEAVRLVARWYVESEAIKAQLRSTSGSLRPGDFETDEP